MFSDAVRARIARQYAAGQTLSVLSVQYGASTPTITAIVRDAGVTVRPRGARAKALTGRRRDALLADFAAGASLEQLAREHAVTGPVVVQTLRAHIGATLPAPAGR